MNKTIKLRRTSSTILFNFDLSKIHPEHLQKNAANVKLASNLRKILTKLERKKKEKKLTNTKTLTKLFTSGLDT